MDEGIYQFVFNPRIRIACSELGTPVPDGWMKALQSVPQRFNNNVWRITAQSLFNHHVCAVPVPRPQGADEKRKTSVIQMGREMLADLIES